MASDCVSPTESARPDAAAERAPLFRRPRSVAAVPVVFLGLGLYRAWIEIVFVGTFWCFLPLPCRRATYSTDDGGHRPRLPSLPGASALLRQAGGLSCWARCSWRRRR